MNGTFPFIEFTNIWETAYDVTDTTFDCNVNRSKGDTSTSMYLINHFLDKIVLGNPVPDVAHANVTNAATGTGSLGEQVASCTTQNGRPPNFMLVDVSQVRVPFVAAEFLFTSSTNTAVALSSKSLPTSMVLHIARHHQLPSLLRQTVALHLLVPLRLRRPR